MTLDLDADFLAEVPKEVREEMVMDAVIERRSASLKPPAQEHYLPPLPPQYSVAQTSVDRNAYFARPGSGSTQDIFRKPCPKNTEPQFNTRKLEMPYPNTEVASRIPTTPFRYLPRRWRKL